MSDSAQRIIEAMPENIRKQAELSASEAGMSLTDYVDEQLSVQLSDDDLDAVAGGTVDVGVRADYRGGDIGVGVGARIRIGRS